jgi:hypothetical protein
VTFVALIVFIGVVAYFVLFMLKLAETALT